MWDGFSFASNRAKKTNLVQLILLFIRRFAMAGYTATLFARQQSDERIIVDVKGYKAQLEEKLAVAYRNIQLGVVLDENQYLSNIVESFYRENHDKLTMILVDRDGIFIGQIDDLEGWRFFENAPKSFSSLERPARIASNAVLPVQQEGKMMGLRGEQIKNLTRSFPVQVGNRSDLQTAWSGGFRTTQTYVVKRWVSGDSPVHSIQLVFSNNLIDGTGGDVNLTQTLTVKASIQYNGKIYVAYFDDNRNGTIAPNKTIVSDVIPVRLLPGTPFLVRTYVVTTDTGATQPNNTADNARRIPVLGVKTVNGSTEEGYIATADQADNPAAAIETTNINPYAPIAVLGIPEHFHMPVVALIGSSSVVGEGDVADTTELDVGFLSRALDLDYSVMRMGSRGDTISAMQTRSRYRRKVMQHTRPTHAIQQLGSNDITNGATFEQMKERLTWMWDWLAGYGVKVIQTTFAPKTTSTDNWSSLANQTLDATDPVRVAVNEWLKTTASHPALVKVWDICESVTDAETGKWRVTGTAFGYTPDGTHCSPFAHKILESFVRGRSRLDITF